MLSKKLQQIEGTNGLWAFYGGGGYTVTVWQNDDDTDQYDMVFCRSDTDIPHSRDTVSRNQLEIEMRKYQRDLRNGIKLITTT